MRREPKKESAQDRLDTVAALSKELDADIRSKIEQWPPAYRRVLGELLSAYGKDLNQRGEL